MLVLAMQFSRGDYTTIRCSTKRTAQCVVRGNQMDCSLKAEETNTGCHVMSCFTTMTAINECLTGNLLELLTRTSQFIERSSLERR